jgi:hypothetical protein
MLRRREEESRRMLKRTRRTMLSEGGAPEEKDWEVNNCSLLTAHCSFSV